MFSGQGRVRVVGVGVLQPGLVNGREEFFKAVGWGQEKACLEAFGPRKLVLGRSDFDYQFVPLKPGQVKLGRPPLFFAFSFIGAGDERVSSRFFRSILNFKLGHAPSALLARVEQLLQVLFCEVLIQ